MSVERVKPLDIGAIQGSCTCEIQKTVKRGKVAHPGGRNAKKEGEDMPSPSRKAYLIRFQLAEVALQQALESLAMAGLVAGHLVHGVMDGVQVQLLGLLGQLELAVAK